SSRRPATRRPRAGGARWGCPPGAIRSAPSTSSTSSTAASSTSRSGSRTHSGAEIEERPAMDATPYLEPRPAPRPVFDHLDERGDRPRFLIRDGDGWRPVTWREHTQEIEDVALYCAERGLTPGARAAVF